MKKIVLSVLMFFISFVPAAGKSDIEAWSGIKTHYEASDTWEFRLSGEYRMKSDVTEFDRIFFEPEVVFDPEPFDLMKPLEFSAGFRYYLRNDTEGGRQGIRDYIRFNLDASYDVEFLRASLEYRFRYQRKNEIGDKARHTWDWRHKFTAEYNIDNWKPDPELSFEMWISDEPGEPKGYNRYRVVFETEFDTGKKQEINPFIGYEEQFRGTKRSALIVGFVYKFDLAGNGGEF